MARAPKQTTDDAPVEDLPLGRWQHPTDKRRIVEAGSIDDAVRFRFDGWKLIAGTDPSEPRPE